MDYDLKHFEKNDTINHMDITDKWINTKERVGLVVERLEYVVGGVTYMVDGKHIVLRPSELERNVANVLSEKYGKRVELIPQVLYPQGVQTPDYLIDGERFDLKSPTGRGKNLLYGLIAKKKNQSHNFIIDVTNCPLSMEELEIQTNDLFRSPRTGFLEKIVFIKGNEVIRVFSRKQKK